MSSAAARTLSTHDLLDIVLSFLSAVSSDSDLVKLRLICKAWNYTVCTSPTLRRITWHAEYIPPPGTPWPPRHSRGFFKPPIRVINEKAMYLYVDPDTYVKKGRVQPVQMPNPVFKWLGFQFQYQCCCLQDGMALDVGNAYWATMLASRPGAWSWHISFWHNSIQRTGGRQSEFEVTSAKGPLLVGDVVYVLNKLREQLAIIPGAGDKDLWEAGAWACHYAEEGSMDPEQIPECYGRIGPNICFNRMGADIIVTDYKEWCKTGKNLFVLNRPDFARPGPWKYEHISCEVEDEDWSGSFQVLFGEL